MEMLLRTHKADFDGKCEVLKADKFPVNHQIVRKQNARIITLIPDQTFLDHLQKFPSNYPFSAGLCKRLYIREGARIDHNDPEAKKIKKRPRFAKRAMERFLRSAHDELVAKADQEQEVAERMGRTNI